MRNKFLLLLALLLCAHVAFADPLIDDATDCDATAATSCTVSHTTGVQANMVLYGGCAITGSTTARTLSTVTYNGDSLTTMSGSAFGVSDGDNSRVEWFYRIGPDTGANNIVFTLSGAFDGYLLCVAVTVYNAPQVTVHRAPDGRTGGTMFETACSVAPASASGDLALYLVGWRYPSQGLITPGAGQTEIGSSIDTAKMKAYSKAGAAGTVTISTTWATGGWTPSSCVGFSIPAVASTIPVFQSHYRQMQ